MVNFCESIAGISLHRRWSEQSLYNRYFCSDALLVSIGQLLQIYPHMYVWLEAFNFGGGNGYV